MIKIVSVLQDCKILFRCLAEQDKPQSSTNNTYLMSVNEIGPLCSIFFVQAKSSIICICREMLRTFYVMNSGEDSNLSSPGLIVQHTPRYAVGESVYRNFGLSPTSAETLRMSVCLEFGACTQAQGNLNCISCCRCAITNHGRFRWCWFTRYNRFSIRHTFSFFQ